MLKKSRVTLLVSLLTFSSFIIYYSALTKFYKFRDFSELNSIEVHSVSVKSIVSYSLEKQISFQGQEVQCSSVVNLSGSLEHFDKTWERIPGSQIYVYSAYEDARLSPYFYVRVLAMSKGAWETHLYCHLEMHGGDAVRTVEANITHMWLEQWHPLAPDMFEPLLISCKLPSTITLAHIRRVALSLKPCRPTALALHLWKGVQPPSADVKNMDEITVCVKPLRFKEDIAQKLIGWLEMNKILGADRIEMFVSDVHPHTGALLRWYAANGPLLHLYNYTSITDVKAGTVPSVWQKRREELIAYNDCLYRNAHTSRFVLPLDVDEIVVPRLDYTWRQFLARLFKKRPHLLEQYASLSVPNAYFMDQFTSVTDRNREAVGLLRNVVRSKFSPDGESGKSFVLTKSTLVVFNHYALKTLRPGIQNVYFLSPDLVQMNHYKSNCDAILLPECVHYLFNSTKFYDPIIYKYKKVLLKNIHNVYSLFKL